MNDHADAYEALMQFLYRAPIGLVQIALDGTIEMLNPMSSNLLMPLAPDGNLDNLFDVLSGVAPTLQPMAAAFPASSGVICEALRVDLRHLRSAASGTEVLSVSLLKVDGGRIMASLSDVTQEVRREQETLARRLDSAARIDALTQMPNRRAVQEQLQRILERGSVDQQAGFAVLFINCDRFKQINDAFGHGAADQVLMMVAERIRTTLRPPTDQIFTVSGPAQMAARIGGDEFVVVLDGMRSADDVHSVALRLLKALGNPYRVDGHSISCPVSMGIVLADAAAAEADEILRDASIAMADAKRDGGSRALVFEPAMRERSARRGDIESDLRVALLQEQLFVVYQPVVGLRGDHGPDYSAGVEALVRWQHPVRGLVSPIEFIDIAEQSGLIGALGDFVLERACRDFMRWQAELGARAPRLIAVNLSRAQLAKPGWADTVKEILAAYGMSAGALQLEVTESLAAQDESVTSGLHALRALGVTLALDDFGTGYSSLSSLHLLPVNTVKIDRSFVSQVDTSPHHRTLVEATVMVARSLGMSTVAEGIETAEQAAVVRELGCDKGQGYLFSRPLTTEALVAWLVER
ncbi:putative bifunctional diguanylate cyclase/phosphodiesterase [Massilia soli]|uniref:EAL domain-containing protein n=1 Tax=Massilia soli TaxID=2792854 RepID=A0ABS7SS65_9BURK|nr:EAL domain-containing protein [Massilia soli]MBZ2208789.1 EAL domain-containing protein [Massilia soli]